MASTNPESQTNEANANLTYKDQLDETASKVKYGNQNNGKGEGGFVNQVAEKVSQYVPAVGKVLGTDAKTESTSSALGETIPGPPERPHHDTQIEEFVRDQHRSKTEDETLAGQ